ncbi:hypothetical protein MSSAC_3430 [Methanosarcina siciliae C2J]|uniref:Polymerase/histidinol phosphatase N-terminal domain-containing protein n=1 Tax=Methanosarcina siciliae C2J TaxID=1434118 RepID=A0A0E3PQA4_9EURY|nr:PHP domain-containing protein [Methanosarcina siciliae]AKB38020.1 hypothetical protein MSSAC_3430 [Methanosarcina siciliae C2J]
MNAYYNFDLHVHSVYSKDSLLTPERIIKVAMVKGINSIAITDHDTILGGLKTKSIKQNSLLVIIGSEIKTDYGDLIGLFLNEEIKSRIFPEVIEEIKDQGGFVVLPHPYRRKKFPDNGLFRKIDVLEGINGRTSEELNQKAQSLARELSKPVVGGSDAHFSFELGTVMNCANHFCNDEEELRRLILDNNSTCRYKVNSSFVRKSNILLSAFLKRVKNI